MIGIKMIQIKTISQFTHLYEVPDNLMPDFTNWLMQSDDRCGDYEVDQTFINELVMHAERRPDIVGTGESQPSTCGNTSYKCNEGTRTK